VRKLWCAGAVLLGGLAVLPATTTTTVADDVPRIEPARSATPHPPHRPTRIGASHRPFSPDGRPIAGVDPQYP